MSDILTADRLFFTDGGLDRQRTEELVGTALGGADDGELFLEYRQAESLVFDDGRLKSASFDTDQGFGLRAVAGEATGYAHSTSLSEEAVKRAGETVRAALANHDGALALPPVGTNAALYSSDNPLAGVPFAEKVGVLAAIDAYARAKDERVRQVSVSLAGEWRVVEIVRPNADRVADVRPLVRLNVSVVVERDGRQESGSYGTGGRTAFADFLRPETWRFAADEALRQALVNLDSVDTPAGEMVVVLGPGWPGILLHEAIGHGLEGDFHRKKTSAFAGRIGERIGAPGVSIVDDGTLPSRRGSLSIDDEGTPSQRTMLIEDGVLVGLMQDRQNSRLMGSSSTGNGRRQSFAHRPMPRMTNTCMLAGAHDPGEIIASVERGLYAVSFGGGQVDITSGKFVFSCTEAYKIEGGRIGAPVKGATLIGDGATVLRRVSMIGNDLQLDPGIGTCGKDGQGVPVGVGQPTLRIDALTVGGTSV
ncbi:MAG: metalloprotease TldD [Rhodospirillales bacterium]|nr:metalloprotease TldD [Rhodospirillales bacterium]